jgi:hypothetical protein
MKFNRIASLAIVAISMAIPAQAAVVLDNTTETVGGYDTIGGPTSASGAWLAAAFQTGSNPAGYNLGSIGMAMRFEDGFVVPSGGFTVAVYSDALGVPAASPISGGSLSGSANPSSTGVYAYTASAATLAPNTQYWVVAKVPSGNGTYLWNYASDTTQTTAAPGWTVEGLYAFRDFEQSWQALNEFQPFMMSISATAVPEPSEYAACGGVLAAGVAGYLRRRRAA